VKTEFKLVILLIFQIILLIRLRSKREAILVIITILAIIFGIIDSIYELT
jgi:hypothetical protein